MRRICSILLCVVIVFAMPNAFAAEKDAIQRGRAFFMNYCTQKNEFPPNFSIKETPNVPSSVRSESFGLKYRLGINGIQTYF